ncbi:MAG: serine/threonine protein kinase [Bacilli bacterium]|nr:serine/threonine protein kinase [Bacilli bacterium]
MPLKMGSLVDGRYRITARIGHGGMAEVYEANDIIKKQVVAIKLIREDVMANPINLKRFENEATIAASLNHENIMKVYNHGTIDGRPYIANEFIKGQTLKDVLDFRGVFKISEAISIMLQLASALDYAHMHNIVHRDVKPDNIYLLADGTIKLGDFGIAEADGLNRQTTLSNDIVGSVHYLAPEISRGKPATVQSDIYAAGVTFYEIITGHVPFEKDTPINVAVAHIKEKFPPVSKYISDCPKEIEKIISKCTKKYHRDRYSSAKQLFNDLELIKNNQSILKREKRNIFARIFGFK